MHEGFIGGGWGASKLILELHARREGRTDVSFKSVFAASTLNTAHTSAKTRIISRYSSPPLIHLQYLIGWQSSYELFQEFELHCLHQWV